MNYSFPFKLTDLEPRWLRYEKTPENQQTHPWCDNLASVQGIIFLCPKCLAEVKKREGVHSVICWFEDLVPDDAVPGPGRWKPQGTGFDDLSFVPGKHSNSVLLLGGCAWHGFVTNGMVT